MDCKWLLFHFGARIVLVYLQNYQFFIIRNALLLWFFFFITLWKSTKKSIFILIDSFVQWFSKLFITAYCILYLCTVIALIMVHCVFTPYILMLRYSYASIGMSPMHLSSKCKLFVCFHKQRILCVFLFSFTRSKMHIIQNDISW